MFILNFILYHRYLFIAKHSNFNIFIIFHTKQNSYHHHMNYHSSPIRCFSRSMLHSPEDLVLRILDHYSVDQPPILCKIHQECPSIQIAPLPYIEIESLHEKFFFI